MTVQFCWSRKMMMGQWVMDQFAVQKERKYPPREEQMLKKYKHPSMICWADDPHKHIDTYIVCVHRDTKVLAQNDGRIHG